MVNSILKHRRSDVAGKVPLPGDLVAGEISVNTHDGKAFMKKDDGEVVEIGSEIGYSVALAGATSVYETEVEAYTITDYSAFATYAVAAANGSASIDGDTITYTAPGTGVSDTLTVTRDGIDFVFPITILDVGIAQPTNAQPTNGATDQNGTVSLQSSAFAWIGIADTHQSSDWQVATDAGFTNIVASTTADTGNLTDWTVTGLNEATVYHWRVRHTGAANGTSPWSTGTTFTTADSFGGLIGVAGTEGFGVGTYPDVLPAGFSALTGSDDPTSPNYGNYQYSDGSVVVFIPRFYYRIGSPSSPRYAVYGLNAVDIAGVDTFDTEGEANAAGYALHRAFIDGGEVKHGFFIDKYQASKNGSTAVRSVAGAEIVSLTSGFGITDTGEMTGGAGNMTDAVKFSRARGAGFNCASLFMYGALALLSLAHGQAATGSAFCAWYDAAKTENYPKGANTWENDDIDDGSVTFLHGYDSNAYDKPRTGASANFNKTTHNGQASGVANINGGVDEAALGVTWYGDHSGDLDSYTGGNAYVLKETTALADLTEGWGSGNAAWGGTAHLSTLYDFVSDFFPFPGATAGIRMGNGSGDVLDDALSGTGWLKTGAMVPINSGGYSSTGTNLFGKDYIDPERRQNGFPTVGGSYASNANAGMWAVNWYRGRSSADATFGFRAGFYAN